MSSNILIRNETEDERKALQSTFLDDLDLVPSKRDGRLVAVAMAQGEHICWQCAEPFGSEHHPELGPEEKQLGHSRVMLHRRCINARTGRIRSARSYNDIVEGLQIRRRIAETAKRSQSIADAAAGKKKTKE